MKKRMVRSKKAFTIVEFLLAMTFLAVLLMGIATVTIRILDIYRKGLSLRAINATGQDILNDLSRTVGGSPIVEKINPDTTDKTEILGTEIMESYSKYFFEAGMDVAGGKTAQSGGVFCTGAYSYIWNTAPAIRNIRDNPTDQTAKDRILWINDRYYKFARIPDEHRTVCNRNNSGNGLATNQFTGIDDKEIVSLISDDDNDLALYDFVVLPASQNDKTGQIFYSGSFILATMRGGVNVLSNGDFCTGTNTMYGSDVEDTDQEFNYCAVNKFNFAVRATGESDNAPQYGER